MNSALVDIWLIEDKDTYRNSVQTILNDTNQFHCSQAFTNCEDALSALSSASPPSVILLDIGLPGMSGIEGIDKIKALSPSTEIIILTVFDDDDNVFNAICAGASGYLLKSSPKNAILEAITEVRSGGAPMNPAIARKALSMFRQLGSVPPSNKYGLTAREKEVLQQLVDDNTKKEIADNLFVSFHTVNTHLKNIYTKLQVNTRSGVVAKALRERLL